MDAEKITRIVIDLNEKKGDVTVAFQIDNEFYTVEDFNEALKVANLEHQLKMAIISSQHLLWK